MKWTKTPAQSCLSGNFRLKNFMEARANCKESSTLGTLIHYSTKMGPSTQRVIEFYVATFDIQLHM